jgi:hypothetical protein
MGQGAPFHSIQPSFAGGEFSPSLGARVDIAKYLTGLKTARNVTVLPHGGIRNRPGSYYVATAGKSSAAVRLIPFVASTSQAYVVELGDGYARFYTSGAQVQVGTVPSWATSTIYAVGNFVTQSGTTYYCIVAHTSGTFATDLAAGKWRAQTAYEVPTPWAAADLFKLKIAQSAQTLYFAHPSYAPRQLTFFASNSWTLTAYAFQNGPFMLSNNDTGRTLTPSATDSKATKTISHVDPYTGIIPQGGSAQYKVALTTSAAHGLSTGATTTVANLDGALGTQLNGGTFYVSVISTTQIRLFYNAALTSPVVYTGSADGNFSGYAPGAGTITSNASVTLTANFNCFASTHVGALFQLTRTITAQTITDASFTANTHTSSSIPCGQNWSIITFGSWTGKILVQISIDGGTTWKTVQTLQSSGSNNYQTSGTTGESQCLLRVIGDTGVTWSGTLTIDLTASSFDWNGIVKVLTYVNATQVTISIVNSEGLADTNSTWQWSEGSWSDYRGWPSCVTFFQDRLVWASTTTEPATGWATKTALYTDFDVSSPLVDSDSLSFVLPTRQLNAIQNMVVMPNGMIALTSDSEWNVGPGSSGVFTPTSIQQSIQGHRGSAYIDPVLIGNELIFMQQMGSVARSFQYSLAVQGFDGPNVSLISQHLFTGYSIVEMAFQQEPDSIVWAVRSDGALLSLTYLREQEVSAWTRHDTDGYYESVTQIPNATLGINEVWCVVRRTINGSTVRYIERMAKRDQGTDPKLQFFVDCGLTYNGAPATVISGLSHLEGKSVAVLADGCVLTPKTVTSGQITLSDSASIVTVGLPYVSDVETLRLEIPSQSGTMQGRRIAIPEVTVRFWGFARRLAARDGAGGRRPDSDRHRELRRNLPARAGRQLRYADPAEDARLLADARRRLRLRSAHVLPAS